MDKTIQEIIVRIEELLKKDEGFGKAVARDFVGELALEMEALSKERIQLEKKMATAGSKGDRTALVEEVAVRLEKIGGKARFVKEIIDEVIERMFGLDEQEITMIKNHLKSDD